VIDDEATQVPASRFANRYSQEDIQSTKASQAGSSVWSPRSVPDAVVTTGKSFSDALKGTSGDGSNSEPSNQDSASTITNPTDNRSTKSKEELETENDELRQVIVQLKEQQAQITKTHDQQMAQVLERLQQLESSFAARPQQAPQGMLPMPAQPPFDYQEYVARVQQFQLEQQQQFANDPTVHRDPWPLLQSPPKQHRQHHQSPLLENPDPAATPHVLPTNAQATPRKSNQTGSVGKPVAHARVPHHLHGRSGRDSRSRAHRSKSPRRRRDRSLEGASTGGHDDDSVSTYRSGSSKSSRSRSRSRDRQPDGQSLDASVSSKSSRSRSSRRSTRHDHQDPTVSEGRQPHQQPGSDHQDAIMDTQGQGSDSVSPSGASGPHQS